MRKYSQRASNPQLALAPSTSGGGLLLIVKLSGIPLSILQPPTPTPQWMRSFRSSRLRLTGTSLTQSRLTQPRSRAIMSRPWRLGLRQWPRLTQESSRSVLSRQHPLSWSYEAPRSPAGRWVDDCLPARTNGCVASNHTSFCAGSLKPSSLAAVHVACMLTGCICVRRHWRQYLVVEGLRLHSANRALALSNCHVGFSVLAVPV